MIIDAALAAYPPRWILNGAADALGRCLFPFRRGCGMRSRVRKGRREGERKMGTSNGSIEHPARTSVNRATVLLIGPRQPSTNQLPTGTNKLRRCRCQLRSMMLERRVMHRSLATTWRVAGVENKIVAVRNATTKRLRERERGKCLGELAEIDLYQQGCIHHIDASSL